MQKTCKQCKNSFEITDDDLKFYDKVSPVFNGKKYLIPPPTLCPDCRQQRRLVPVNEINLFWRKCDATGKNVISAYHQDSPYKVYDQEYWWGDKWDAMDYGRDFDFKRPFFDQLNELLLAVPRPNVFTGYLDDINCTYTNGAGKNKNCYLIFDADYCEDTYYSYSVNHTINCIDCHRTKQSELCYETLDSTNCYNCQYVYNSASCSDSAFLENCLGCKHCFMCVNLRQKEYYIYNKPSTKEEYEKFIKMLSSRENVEKFKAEFKKFKLQFPVKYIHSEQSENVSGNYLYNCKNVFNSYEVNGARDCKNVYQMFCSDTKDTCDCNECGEFVELCYECSCSGYNLNHALFCLYVIYQSSDILYCAHCHYSSNLFGCSGLKRKKYCILNKQYTKEQYEELVPKIIEHMKKTGEWGEYLPGQIGAFSYNDSLVMDFYPFTKEEALSQGYKWRDQDIKSIPQTYKTPDDIEQTEDNVLKETLCCTHCGMNFKIIPQELSFYRKHGIPLPTKCFKCRYQDRIKLRNPRKLYERKCMKCGAAIKTTYSPERPETVYCEQCYLKEVY